MRFEATPSGVPPVITQMIISEFLQGYRMNWTPLPFLVQGRQPGVASQGEGVCEPRGSTLGYTWPATGRQTSVAKSRQPREGCLGNGGWVPLAAYPEPKLGGGV